MLVNVEVDVNTGLPVFEMTGILSAEVRESKERVRTGIKNSGFSLKPQRITVNLSPANIRKEGTAFDLPIAVGILTANGIIEDDKINNVLIMGELGLDGSIHSVNGVLPAVCEAKHNGITTCIVPYDNRYEACVIDGINVYGMRELRDVVEFLNDNTKYNPIHADINIISKADYDIDFNEIKGQTAGKRATLVATAGMHNIMYIGPPGSGKTLMAQRIPTILPELDFEESIELSKIYSIAGLLNVDNDKNEIKLIKKRPFRAPHYNISSAGLVGGGGIPKPGELTLASKGVLFLDELTEFKTSILETLRQPLEEKKITLVRLNSSYTYPADIMLVAAINPCKCGYYPDRNVCNCSEYDIKRYLGRISQPFWDRFDINVEMSRVKYEDLFANITYDKHNTDKYNTDGYNSADMKQIVERTYSIQKERFCGKELIYNSQMSVADIKKYCVLGKEESKLMEQAYKKLGFTARGYHKILKVARTIADIDQSENIKSKHLSEAIMYRSYDNKIRI